MSAPFELNPLEPRRFLSATLNSHGVLYILGTRRSDTITLVLERRHRGTVDVIINRRVQSFPAAQVRNIIVAGGRGDDRVVFSSRFGTLPGRHTNSGGAGSDLFYDDSGTDYPVDNGSVNTSTPTPVDDPGSSSTPPGGATTASPPTVNGSDFNDSPPSAAGSGGDFGDPGDTGTGGDFIVFARVAKLPLFSAGSPLRSMMG